ncbi:class I SAM-dependent methyltransferase [Loktanella sp. SALINAS62]|uniref:class I SAM-dependent methyltransferase n=1 Tax=Loktanella sp. SALINAS62 TaxID=2706124 RepID=UPI001B8C6AE2|nr:class I SAM-dependent methyltransferase [Loktanella sp. SALINAS62]MBS1303358.1 class I SAM-dependent methyltransferase [Loktanella sp. SALINAS62]
MSIRARAERHLTVDHAGSAVADQSVKADWSAYAAAYDLLSKHNPEYQKILSDFELFLSQITSPQVIYDIGGGTGNYTQIAARVCPDSNVCLAEPDPGMIAAARAKLAAFDNIRYENRALEDIDAPGTADLIVCVHALYAMTAPEQRLTDLRRLLRPGGVLYLVDLGRLMDVTDWRSYLFSHLKKEHGLAGALRIFWQGREIAKQNTVIRRAQKKGVYWTHSDAEIAAAATAAGLEIIRQDTVYRGYSDLLICRALP